MLKLYQGLKQAGHNEFKTLHAMAYFMRIHGKSVKHEYVKKSETKKSIRKQPKIIGKIQKNKQ